MHDQNPPPPPPPPPPPQQLRNTRSLLLHHLLRIPEEILTDEILPRLPVKSLSRFKCVSKSWRSLIESDRFIKIQHRNSAKNPRVIFSSNKHAMKDCSLQSFLNSSPTNDQEKAGTLVGCCNGVVCFYNYQDRRFWLWNPAIRASIELPKVDGVLKKLGFGWDESRDAYKVFAVMLESKKRIGKVYSSKTNSWRTIPRGSRSVFYAFGAFAGGKLHWVCRRKHGIEVQHAIECFDLEREEFGRIELPLNNAAKDPHDRPLLWLGEVGGCLSILFDLPESLEVWVMKEYGVKDSWSKLFTIPTGFEIFLEIYDLITPLFGEDSNGDIFIIYAETLWLYSPKHDAFSLAANNVDFFAAYLYAESLVSPKRILDSTNAR